MNDGAKWHRAKGEKQGGNADDWKLPIQGMGYVLLTCLTVSMLTW